MKVMKTILCVLSESRMSKMSEAMLRELMRCLRESGSSLGRMSFDKWNGLTGMGNVISIGNQGFDSIRENNYFFIDKSSLIKEWWDSGDVVTLITRPSRFGKTLNMNIALRYMKGFPWGIWRDTHIKIEGKAVYGLQTAFLTDWYVVDRTLITSSRYFPEVGIFGKALIQIVTSDPVGEWRDIMQGLLIAISSSRKYFYIQTPYLLPTEPILMALKTAALAGVDVRIMIPARADTWITHLGSLSYLDDIMRAGVRIYLYQKGFLHSKLMVSDDTLSTVGSTNMDFRSFEHNFEVNAFMYDPSSALLLKGIFLQDQKDAILLQRKTWIKRPWYQKAQESIVRLLAPLL